MNLKVPVACSAHIQKKSTSYVVPSGSKLFLKSSASPALLSALLQYRIVGWNFIAVIVFSPFHGNHLYRITFWRWVRCKPEKVGRKSDADPAQVSVCFVPGPASTSCYARWGVFNGKPSSVEISLQISRGNLESQGDFSAAILIFLRLHYHAIN